MPSNRRATRPLKAVRLLNLGACRTAGLLTVRLGADCNRRATGPRKAVRVLN